MTVFSKLMQIQLVKAEIPSPIKLRKHAVLQGECKKNSFQELQMAWVSNICELASVIWKH